jgi:hypothetical protein
LGFFSKTNPGFFLYKNPGLCFSGSPSSTNIELFWLQERRRNYTLGGELTIISPGGIIDFKAAAKREF